MVSVVVLMMVMMMLMMVAVSSLSSSSSSSSSSSRYTKCTRRQANLKNRPALRPLMPLDRTLPSSSSLSSSVDDTAADLSNDLGRKGMKGYYRRPSRAIEKGGGFFIPGFENERIRILSSTVLLALLIVNRSGVQVATFSQIVTELTGAAMIVLLFLQGIADRFRIDAIDPLSISNSGSYITTIQKASSDSSSSSTLVDINTLESIARAIVQTSSDISYILVMSKDNKVMLELGPISSTTMDASSCTALGSTLRTEDRVSIDSIKTMTSNMSWKPNENIRSLVKVIDSNNGMWLVGSNRNSAELENSNWIQSLIGCPLVI